MILIFFILCDFDLDLEHLYDQATTRLVNFQTIKDSAMHEFVLLAADSVYRETTMLFLLSKFDTESSVERHTLKDILTEIGDPAVDLIVSKLDYRGSDGEARSLKQSLWVLGEIGSAQIVEPIARFIHDEDWAVRSGAYTALGKSGSPEAIVHVLEGLADSVALVRKSAFYTLSEIATERELPHLMRGLSDDFYGVRYAALSGIRRLKVQVSAPVGLTDRDRTDYFLVASLDSAGMAYLFNEYTRSLSPAVRKSMYDVLAESLLERALSKESHPLLKEYLKQRIDKQHTEH
jgi:HEAT repeat protein